jgi:hypothetical protein
LGEDKICAGYEFGSDIYVFVVVNVSGTWGKVFFIAMLDAGSRGVDRHVDGETLGMAGKS